MSLKVSTKNSFVFLSVGFVIFDEPMLMHDRVVWKYFNCLMPLHVWLDIHLPKQWISREVLRYMLLLDLHPYWWYSHVQQQVSICFPSGCFQFIFHIDPFCFVVEQVYDCFAVDYISGMIQPCCPFINPWVPYFSFIWMFQNKQRSGYQYKANTYPLVDSYDIHNGKENKYS